MKVEQARPFAQGLLDAARDLDEGPRLGGDLDRLAEVFEPVRGLDGMLRSGVISDRDLAVILEEVARRLELAPTTRHFLELLRQRRVLDGLPRIAREYGILLDRRLNRATARVASAVPLTEQERERLRRVLEKRLRRGICLEETIEPALMGGVVVKVGDLVLDGSLRMRLDRAQVGLVRG